MVERDNVGDRAQCDQIEQRSHIRFGQAAFKSPQFAQSAPERQHHIKNHAHTGYGLALERTALLVRIHNGVSLRQCLRGKVMIGDQNLTADLFGRLNTGNTRNPVINGNN